MAARPGRPSVESYAEALRGISAIERKLLSVHLRSPGQTATAQDLSAAMGFTHYAVVNRVYGGLAARINRITGYQPHGVNINGLVRLRRRNGRWHWTLHREVVDAARQLGWHEVRENSALRGAQPVRAWWFGVNNTSPTRSHRTRGHVHYPDLAPLLRGEVEYFSWPFGGASTSKALYAELQAEDRVVFWMGDGATREWGIIGFGRIVAVDVAAEAVLLARDLLPIRAVTPYPSGRPCRTPVTEELHRIFGLSFRPLRKLFAALGYTNVKPYVITIDRISPDQYQSLLELASAGIGDDPSPGESVTPRNGPGKSGTGRRGVTELPPAAVHTRAAVPPLVVSNPHRDLQRRLADEFRRCPNVVDVRFEENFVDITVERNDGSIDLVEIKSAMSARAALREALGQLLEYRYHALREGRHVRRLYVASPAPLTDSDRSYLEYLRSELGLPVGYAAIA